MEDKNVEVKKESKLFGGLPEHELLDGGFVAISKSTMELMLGDKDYKNMMSLYMFYLYTAKWQNNWSVKATTDYTSNAIGMSKKTTVRVKKKLIDMKLVEDVQRRKSGRIVGHYVKILKPQSTNTSGGELSVVENLQTNTISNNINTISNNNTIHTQQVKPARVVEDNSLTIDSNKLPMPSGFTTPATRMYKLYDELFKGKYGEVAQVGILKKKAILKKLAEQVGEYNLAVALIIYMNWKGATGQDTFIEKLLTNSCHDVIYLPKQITPILAYIKNTLKLSDNDIIKEVNKKLIKYGIYKNSNTTIQNG